MENNKDRLTFFSVLMVGLFILTLLNQGGFFEGAIVFSGIALSSFLIFKRKTEFSVVQILLLLFSVWYFICSILNGFVTEYAFKSLLPFVVFLFSVVIDVGEKKNILKQITDISLYIAIISIIHCVYLCFENETLYRLSFPFNYSNTCGIYFLACLILAKERKKVYKYTFLIAMFLSQSVGAVGLFAIVLLFDLVKKKELKKFFLSVTVMVVLALLFKARLIESIGTFCERLLQMHDGFDCMIKNPLYGIGAGSWENAKNIYQTGFYSAKTIHSNFVQVGAESGILGMLLFLLMIVFLLKEKFENKVIVILILVHSIFDFSLSFSSIGFLIVLLAEDRKKFKVDFTKSIAMVCLLMFIVAATGITAVNQSKEDDFFVRHSVFVAENAAIKANKIKTFESLPDFKYEPTAIIINKSFTKGENYLLEQYKIQPYNLSLKKYIIENCSEETIKNAEEIYASAIDSLSLCGKILYKLKGENL